jgi:hypothetical protein
MAKKFTTKTIQPNTPVEVVKGSYSIAGGIWTDLEVWTSNNERMLPNSLKVIPEGKKLLFLEVIKERTGSIAKFKHQDEIYYSYWMPFKALTRISE